MTQRTDVQLNFSWDVHACIRRVRSADLKCLCARPQEVLGFLTCAARSGGWRSEDGSPCSLANVQWLFVGFAGALGPLAASGFLQLTMPEVIPGTRRPHSSSLSDCVSEPLPMYHICTYYQ